MHCTWEMSSHERLCLSCDRTTRPAYCHHARAPAEALGLLTGRHAAYGARVENAVNSPSSKCRLRY